ncbi:MAG: hypothetical protein AAGG06_09000 [Pseudomonadota bacterium]
MSAAEHLAVGKAFLTGLGAPRSLRRGREVLEPLAQRWNAQAALMLPEASAEAGETGTAYDLAIRAMAGGGADAIGLADELEGRLPLERILSA